MGFASVFRGVAGMLIGVGVAMIFPMLIALAAGENSAGSFLFGAVLCIVAGAGALAAGVGDRGSSGLRDGIVVVLIWWVAVPAFAAVPFTAENLKFGDAYFEAVAALTTTGGWLSHQNAIATYSGTLWRAELQWLGGLASLGIAAAIFIRPVFIGIDTLLPPFSRGETDSSLRSLRNAIAALSSVYALITAVIFAALAIAGASTFEALIMALSLVATGGFAPHEDGIAGFSAVVTWTAFPFIILGGVNFILLARLFRGFAVRGRDVETSAYLLILLCVGVLFWLLSSGADAALLIQEMFNAASLMSTNGFIIGEEPTLIVAMVTAIIGGAAVSTAGGFKILRWLVIMRRAREELRRLVVPNIVTGASPVSIEFGVWMHFIVFTIVLAVLVLGLAISGADFELATAAAASALSNTGPLITLADSSADGYAVFSEPVRWMLAGAMILGRLEAAVALVLLNRAFWRP